MVKSLAMRLVMLLLAFAAGLGQRAALADDPVLKGCVVKLEDDVKLPAQEAGVLVQLAVKEGSQVKNGEVIGKIYDGEAQVKKKAAEYALSGAIKKAKDDIETRYAQKSADVAQKTYERMLDSNRSSEKSVPEVDLLEAKLKWDAAILSAEKATHDRELATYDAYGKQAERDAAQLGIDRRTITSPFDGEIVEIKKHQDEWVSPGDGILRVVRLDTMYVEGAVVQSEYDPHEIQGCDVTVDIEMAHGRKEQVTGRIIYVSSSMMGADKYQVRAEVQNRQEYGRWLLREGMKATMTIHLNTASGTALDVSRRAK